MEPIYACIHKHARRIASHIPKPDFYTAFPGPTQSSRAIFQSDPIIAALRRRVIKHLKNNFGHGLKHAVKVALDVGALMRIEGESAEYTESFIRRRVILVQSAALLHDIDRNQEDHAQKGADTARKMLTSFPLLPEEIEDICRAIHNHEAFKQTLPAKTPEGALASDCLYDADKFRWGPDNFTDTVWRMVSYSRTPIVEFIHQYPRAMEGLVQIKQTFRTHTGKIYGPQFIDLGLAIGKKLFDTIITAYPAKLPNQGD